MTGQALRFDVNVSVPVGRRRITVKIRTDERFVAIVGPSGVGKTTALRVLAGLTAAQGTIRAGGQTYMDETGPPAPPWTRAVGYVPQDAGLFPHLSVEENIMFRAREAMGDLPRRLRIDHVLSRPVTNLSGGEQIRVALARALLTRPRLLLLDEPFAALDRSLRTAVGDALRAHCLEHDVSLVFVSHDEADVSALATHTVRMD